jgi:hypothetical protein
MAKHEGQATVARREPQNWHAGPSVEFAAPQFGQLSVSACIVRILAGEQKVDYEIRVCDSSDEKRPMSNVQVQF